MSLAKVKEAAAAHKDTYVSVPADVIAAALAEVGEKPTPGSLAEHVAQVIARAKNLGVESPNMSLHREKHLAELLGMES